MAGATTTAIDFDGFYLAHYGETVAMAYGFTADLAESQDIAQEAFSRAWQRWKVISHYEQPVSWVRRVATNLAHSRWRKLKLASAYLMRQRAEDLPDLSPDHVDLVVALRTLPPVQRKAVVLHYLVDLPVGQIAEELGVSDGTVKSWLHRGRHALAAELGDEVRRTVSPPAPTELRLSSDKRRVARRATVSVVAAFVAVLLLVTGAQLLSHAKGSPPLVPASPDPSAVVSPSPKLAPAKPAPAAPASCTVEKLPHPSGDGMASYFAGGDPTGHLLLGSSNDVNAYLWRDGNLDKRLVLGGLDDSALHDINSSGTAIGVVLTQTAIEGYVYRNGELVRMEEGAIPRAINESNVIIGAMNDRPAIWRTPTSPPELLNVPPDMDEVRLQDLSEEGLIVGVATKYVSRGVSRTESYLWYPDGTYAQLEYPYDIQPREGGVIQVRGEWAIGNLYVGGSITALRWNLRTGKVEVLPGMEAVESLNEHGWVGYRNGDKIGVRTRDGQDITLPSLPGASSDNGIASARLVSDDGRIVGGEMLVGKGASAEMVAVRWVCK
ncbi:hypothetical protein Rhe02_77450 [Rhizocola hellebori]|uniref:Sigma-70 family RNA polymerase sigma factor n=1 Tax=Rhizocola hellebori TaxID=1392758 RepID=A0A8J3QF11_9ACTN|nr:SigE family RNA polymerase sigma factor [Rhizocola hellebori]GIH09678.1 hypothetical protein Rhe02_77450 [Rhizocola hellebori]